METQYLITVDWEDEKTLTDLIEHACAGGVFNSPSRVKIQQHSRWRQTVDLAEIEARVVAAGLDPEDFK